MNENNDSEDTIDSSAEQYDGELVRVVTYANKFVNRTIIRAIDEINKLDDSTIENDGCPGCEYKESGANPENDWPTSEKMTVQTGLRCVKKMMKDWKSEPAMRGWKFYAEFIGLESDGSSDFYSYQVRWSVPTQAYPEPQVTVSVFVTVEATKSKYPNCPVDVTYVFEGNQFAHRPKITFRPKWIYDVFDIKTMMFKSFKF